MTLFGVEGILQERKHVKRQSNFSTIHADPDILGGEFKSIWNIRIFQQRIQRVASGTPGFNFNRDWAIRTCYHKFHFQSSLSICMKMEDVQSGLIKNIRSKGFIKPSFGCGKPKIG